MTTSSSRPLSQQAPAGLSLLPGADIVGCNTLISCLNNLSLSNLPSPTTKSRFPRAPEPQPTSALGTRDEQRRIYLGPKLSDRATGGPDAGPLIERFSCLFKDRE
jgi:hypothetical protein